MEIGDILRLILLAILLYLSSFFSSAETALTTVSQFRMKTMADEGDKKAELVLRIKEDQNRMLSAILICNNVVNLYASSLSTMIAMKFFGDTSVGIATGVLTFIILIFGEITPKTLANLKAEQMALKYVKFIYWLMTILTPVIFVINAISFVILRLRGIDPNAKTDAITEEELRTIVDVSHEEGVTTKEEKKIINNLFDFGDAVAKDVMIPRVDMSMVDVDATYDELMTIFREEKYTRFPVYEETQDNIIGILNIKDVFLDETPRDAFSIRKLLREPAFTYEFKNVSELMKEMRKNNINVSIVLDEYGDTQGLITMEDMLEEIVGEIRDEFDTDELDNVTEVSPNNYVVDGSMKIDDLNEQLGLELESEEFDSVGGLIIENLEHLPEEGESVDIGNIHLEVDEVNGNHIEKVSLHVSEEEVQEEKSGK